MSCERPGEVMAVLLTQFPMTALREIRILQLLNHDNVTDLVEVCRSKGESPSLLRVTCAMTSDLCCSYSLQQREGQYLSGL